MRVLACVCESEDFLTSENRILLDVTYVLLLQAA